MNSDSPPNNASLNASLRDQVEALRRRFEEAWASGQRPRIEDYLVELQEAARTELFRSLIAIDLHYRRRLDETVPTDEYQSRFPELVDLINQVLDGACPDVSDGVTKQGSGPYPIDQQPLDTSNRSLPKRISERYELRRVLGKGGCGTVYLGHDVSLDRPVAIKLLSSQWFSEEYALETLSSEAQTLAKLNHPAIVAVYDVGRSETGTCYMVMEYVDGQSLADWMDSQRQTVWEAASCIATVAEAVHHAHTRGLVHRDLKPGNILVNAKGRFQVADFGLAVDEDTQRWREGQVEGTAAYMAPEQARGETHRLDGRTDVWSLGVVLYELLTGRRPFRGRDRQELFDEILYREPKPPRQVEDTIPRELERICLKCLAKRMADRYTTAMDLANDLEHWLQAQQEGAAAGSERGSWTTAGLSAPTRPGSSRMRAAPVAVVTRGLRPFSWQDQDFFPELLPGPRDRGGLPESIGFWRSRIDSSDAGFSCGLIYGPSGCGKTSFAKAGLLPRLAGNVTAVYVEAVPDATEARLLKELRKRCPEVASDMGLVESFASLRRAETSLPQRKVLIVLDQFEQWLHAHRAQQRSDLVDALRQCEGQRLQCLLMVRDDFWLATTRFLRAMEVQLVEDQNVALVDLFDPRHAKKVLADFGRALGCLPDRPSELSAEQDKFLDRAIDALMEDGRVVPVRLSLFAEMVKSRHWMPATLDQVGGAEGLGVAFLEESFGARTAKPQHRFHQEAARAVLRALLPEHAADIKGRVRAHEELLEVSGYANRPKDFTELLRILDTDLRLITPTDPEGQQAADSPQQHLPEGERFYQLSHDYLINPLREWLTRKQKESWRGRARLRLEERTAQWKRTKEKRLLPSPAEYLTIRCGVPRKNQMPEERAMMRAAGRRYGMIALLSIALAASIAVVAWGVRVRYYLDAQGRRIADTVRSANASQMRELLGNDLVTYRRWATPHLERLADDQTQSVDQRFRAHLALVPHDRNRVDFLRTRLPDCPLDMFPVVRDVLRPYKNELLDGLWTTWSRDGFEAEKRFRAGLFLAAYDPQSPKWSPDGFGFLVGHLVNASRADQESMLAALEPLRERLLEPLQAVFYDEEERDGPRAASAFALAEFASSAELLATLLADANELQYPDLLHALKSRPEWRRPAINTLMGILEEKRKIAESEAQQIRRGRRRAGAAITLLRLDAPEKALGLFASALVDRESASQFVHGMKARGVTAADVLACLRLAENASSRYSLLLACGEFGVGEIPQAERASVAQMLLKWHREDPDSGVHAACQWLLRQWELGEDGVAAIDAAPRPFDPSQQRTWFVENIGEEHFTFVVFSPGTFIMGSAQSEKDHQEDEEQVEVEITRPFAIADREVTRGQFEAFLRHPMAEEFKGYQRKLPPKEDLDKFAPSDSHPMVGVYWYDAVLYCRWLTKLAGMSDQQQCYSAPPWKPGRGGFPEDVGYDPERPGFRLPSEAEWEYSCRAGTRGAFSFGVDVALLSNYAWFQGNADGRTQLPAQLRANARGLFDMHGNVCEWCNDSYGLYDQGDTRGKDRPSSSPQRRVFRGGSFDHYPRECRSAHRHAMLPYWGGTITGFRIVRTLQTTAAETQ